MDWCLVNPTSVCTASTISALVSAMAGKPTNCFFCNSAEISDVGWNNGTPGEDYFSYKCKICGNV
jgi:hypothetical protein